MLYAKAYESFSKSKISLKAAISLNLVERTKYLKCTDRVLEFKRLHNSIPHTDTNSKYRLF